MSVPRSARNRLCVAMIAKNEEPRIVRALESARGVADAWFVLDTGSTDRTVAVLEDYAKTHRDTFPGVIEHGEFINFSQARNDVLRRARKYGDWLLITDADQEWVRNKAFRNIKKLFTANVDGFLVTSTDDVPYTRIQVVRSSVNWEFAGRTHEVIQPNPAPLWMDPDRRDPLSTGSAKHSPLRVIEHGDGASRAGKHERDVVMLTADVKDNPTSQWAWYRLGLTQQALERHDEAIESFRMSLSLADDDCAELTYVTKVFQARSMRCLGDVEAAERQWLIAAYERPWRRDAFHELMRSLNQRGAVQAAWDLFRQYEQECAAEPSADDVFAVTKLSQPGIWLEAAHAALALGKNGYAKTLLHKAKPLCRGTDLADSCNHIEQKYARAVLTAQTR